MMGSPLATESETNWRVSEQSNTLLVSDPDSGVTSGSELPALPPPPPPPVESPVLERERTNIREKEVRRMRGRPPEDEPPPTEVTENFLASCDEGLLEPVTRLDREPRLPELGNLEEPGKINDPSKLGSEPSPIENLELERGELWKRGDGALVDTSQKA